jgi:DNA helicase-2/ATP-dependent DNA helicase PcrA
VTDFAKKFAEHDRAVVVAPAGCGKTELIADAVACCSARQLILTHTNAGVSSLRKRLNKKKVEVSKYHLETISSFAIRFALAYPKGSSFNIQQPSTNEEYENAIRGASRLMGSRVIKMVLQASYGGVFVDEYQDCSVEQHELTCALADILPCRLVGDPLQGIFDFNGTVLVDWKEQVFPQFTQLEDLAIPWRWRGVGANKELGQWLIEIARPALDSDQRLSFGGLESKGVHWHSLPPSISGDLQVRADQHDDVYVICAPQNPNKPHSMAKNMNNRYKTIEPLTGKDLYEYGRSIQNASGEKRLRNALDFAEICLTTIKSDCNDVFSSHDKNFRSSRKIALKELFADILESEAYEAVRALYLYLEKYIPKPTRKRWQLWSEMNRALAISITEGTTLEDACWEVRTQSRFLEHRIPRKCISRTVLLKGLECDCSVVVDADAFSPKDLYVALTRGSTELHIYSKQPFYPCVDIPTCPKCGKDFVVRENSKTGHLFFGCSAYPECKETAKL